MTDGDQPNNELRDSPRARLVDPKMITALLGVGSERLTGGY
jgi:hypothetical protein